MREMYDKYDSICIDKLKIFAHHGFFDFEKTDGQFFYVSCKLFLDTRDAGNNDDLEQTVNYASVCQDILDFVKNNVFDLIETVAGNMAIMLLDKYKKIMAIEMTISKPEAPVDAEFENISVTARYMRHTAFIAYGSNMGDSKALIIDALNKIDAASCCRIKKKSDMVISKAYGGVEQDDFYNGVIEIETYLRPLQLLELLQNIELQGGRERLVHWGPRTIDLDILLYDDEIIDDERLVVPHPDMLSRDFVLTPLAQIAGYKRHPIVLKTFAQLENELKERYIK